MAVKKKKVSGVKSSAGKNKTLSSYSRKATTKKTTKTATKKTTKATAKKTTGKKTVAKPYATAPKNKRLPAWEKRYKKRASENEKQTHVYQSDSARAQDRRRLAQVPGRRVSKRGNVYYERRSNRSDTTAERRAYQERYGRR